MGTVIGHLHRALPPKHGHKVQSLEFATAAEREAAVFIEADIGREARDLDTGEFFRLLEVDPPRWCPTTTPAAPGPQGPRGPDGPTGATGLEGPQGERGARGATGAEGTVGAAGPTGSAGSERGPLGPIGAPGVQGLAGAKGATGSRGPKGSKGDTGPDGQKGEQGPQGLTGDQGPEGPAGDQGLMGLQGPTGPEAPRADAAWICYSADGNAYNGYGCKPLVIAGAGQWTASPTSYEVLDAVDDDLAHTWRWVVAGAGRADVHGGATKRMFRGYTAPLGGFRVRIRFAVLDADAARGGFFGVDGGEVVDSVSPRTATGSSRLGAAFDSASANWFFVSAGSGPGYPPTVRATAVPYARRRVMETTVFAPSGGGSITLSLLDVASGANASTVINPLSTPSPLNNDLLNPRAFINLPGDREAGLAILSCETWVVEL